MTTSVVSSRVPEEILIEWLLPSVPRTDTDPAIVVVTTPSTATVASNGAMATLTSRTWPVERAAAEDGAAAETDGLGCAAVVVGVDGAAEV